jgi:NAD-dependent DNA ligase
MKNSIKNQEEEKRKRIRLSLFAYAYEVYNDSLISDCDYDTLAESINLEQDTGNTKLDNWFRKHYNSFTAMWIHHHPEKRKLENLYKRLKKTVYKNG